jgi:hypothetical protein
VKVAREIASPWWWIELKMRRPGVGGIARKQDHLDARPASSGAPAVERQQLAHQRERDAGAAPRLQCAR